MPGAGVGGPTHESVGNSTGPSEAIHWLIPVGRSGESIAAGYLGFLCLFLTILALVPFGFIGSLLVAGLTIWLAVRALKKAESGGHGRGRAIFGLVGAGAAILASIVGMYATFAVAGS
jgi:membrane protein implicated in regulation of membrane protease activity